MLLITLMKKQCHYRLLEPEIHANCLVMITLELPFDLLVRCETNLHWLLYMSSESCWHLFNPSKLCLTTSNVNLT